MIKEFKPIKRPTAPMPLDVKIELGNLRHEGYNAEFVYSECEKLVKTGKSEIVSSESAARWIFEYQNVLLKAFLEHWDLDDPPKYWTGE
ncbi:MAG: hypothetical protein MRZ40_10250 [Ligilactobacillus animalis]|uniref:hypothetical protein n=1 Tax=Ligilactobacillus animalis TaxID=1605 RepID=UPI00242C084D|nr:hypothetical protein [Ligilactobacillus animalis]MCI5942934.1 hypothetical protein [Ligilactobacillus animalis]MDY2993768.1 hypothetical protein [Ligilactobacillus animalis]